MKLTAEVSVTEVDGVAVEEPTVLNVRLHNNAAYAILGIGEYSVTVKIQDMMRLFNAISGWGG